MSWKSLVSAGVLCVLASPVFADPSLQVTNMGLDASGNWRWRVTVTPTSPLPGGGTGTPIDAEVGFRELVGALLDANNLSTGAGDDFDTAVPGTPIWSWENPGTGTNGFPEGLQSNCAGGGCTEDTPGDDPNSVFAALGSQIYTTTGAKDFIEILVGRPVATSATSNPNLRTTTIQWRGAYATGSDDFRLAEYNAAGTTTLVYDIAGSSATRTATAGDADLTGGVGLLDLAAVLDNFDNATLLRWQDGNFDASAGGPGLTDLGTVLDNFDAPSGGGGSGGGSAIPEPATATLISLGIFSVLGLASRRRK